MEQDAILQRPPPHPELPITLAPQTLPSRPVKIASKESTPAIAPKPVPAERMGPITSASPPNGHAMPNGHHAPPPTPGEQALSAVRQLSEQVQWCVASCMEQNKHLERLDHTMHRIYADINNFSVSIDKFRRDLQANPSNGRRPEDPMDVEILQDAMSKMQSKVNELDTIKMQMELVRSRLRRVEETTVAPNSASSAPGPPSSSSTSQHEPTPHHPAAPLTLATSHHGERLPPPAHFQPIEPRVEPRLETRIEPRRELPRPEPIQGPHPQPIYQSAYPPVPSQAPPMESERSPSASWATVNGPPNSNKRVLPAEPGVADTPVDDSPKRQRVTSSDFRPSYPEGPGSFPSRIETNQETGRLSDPHSYPDSSSALTFVPYSSQDADPDDSWRPESQREQLDGRRRGRGGGRGRGRKTVPQPTEIGTPEWERPDWTGSQVSPDGFYQPITPDLVEARSGRTTLIRRSSGGAQGAQTPSRLNTMDPYAHTKKSRTKPIRNANGILIRKDGRPDMRSQSSAANLRKVHARKEQQERSSAEGRHTPTSGLATAPVIGTDGSADEDEESASSGPTPTDERHAAIMGKIFPHGYESKDRMDVAGQYFRTSSSSPAERKLMPHALDSERASVDAHVADFRPVNMSSAEKAEPRIDESEDGAMRRTFTQSTTESELARAERALDGDGDSHMRDGFEERRIQNGDRFTPRKHASPVADTQAGSADSTSLARDGHQ